MKYLGYGFNRITDKNAIRGTLDVYMMQKDKLDSKFVSSVFITSKNGIYVCVNVSSAVTTYDKYGIEHKKYSFAWCDEKHGRPCLTAWLDDIGYIETMYPALDRFDYKRNPGMPKPSDNVLEMLKEGGFYVKPTDEVINIAKKMANKSTMKYKLAAVIYDNDGNILGRGYNKRLKDRSGKPATVKFGIPTFSIHAEIACIMWAIKKFGINQITNQNIYIHRSNNKIAKPCDCCQSVIDMLKLHIYYSNEVN